MTYLDGAIVQEGIKNFLTELITQVDEELLNPKENFESDENEIESDSLRMDSRIDRFINEIESDETEPIIINGEDKKASAFRKDDKKVLDCFHQAMRDMRKEDRPKERMLAYGEKVLSDAELLALIIKTGTKDHSALELSQKILNAFDGDLSAFITADIHELIRDDRLKGIGEVKACQIKAAFELGNRARRKYKGRPSGANPGEVAAYLINDMMWYDQEHFKILLLDTKLRIFNDVEISIGSANASIAHPREVFTPAVRQHAMHVIIAHNHPSGDPQPSPEDIALTTRLREAGEILGIDVLDHVIIGDEDYFSFKEMGMI